MNYKGYPPDWKQISLRIRNERAGGQCEWEDNGVRCEARNKQPHPLTGSKVVLTVAHLHDMNPMNCADTNLAALCQFHHLRLDAKMHGQRAAETRRRNKLKNQPTLF